MKDKKTEKKGFFSGFLGLCYAILLALLIRTVLFEPFSIPSGSMFPTLLVGDYLYVSKSAYGYSRHSILGSPPLFDGRILFTSPKRGDVVVFRDPRDNSTFMIKRLIGLPGDEISLKNGILYINGKEASLERIEDYEDVVPAGWKRSMPQYIETLPGEVKHKIIRFTDAGTEASDSMEVRTVPKGHYFMMGDNRNNSADSRYLKEEGGIGFIAEDLLIGPAKFIFFSIEYSILDIWKIWKWPEIIRLKRFFSAIK